MKGTTTEVIGELTLAEASAWLTRLQETPRTAATEAAFREWLAASATHARAFDRVSEVWELVAGAAQPVRPRTARSQRAPSAHRFTARRAAWGLASACAALILAAIGLKLLQPSDQVYQTEVGAQRTVVLEDTTRVTLNTDTRLAVAYRQHERRILLERGEALFEVARNPQRPFVVQSGGEQVVALGTTFDVRSNAEQVAVMLVEGKVSVGPRPNAPDGSAPVTVLLHGERLTVRADGTRQMDHPRLESALAWQRGQAYFEDTPLSEAVGELNRYGGTRIRLGAPDLATLRVSGVFSTRDPEQFAVAVASLHQLRSSRDGGEIVLRR